MEDGHIFTTVQELLDSFANLGYNASSVEQLVTLLEGTEIRIYMFKNSCEDIKK